MTFRLKNKGKRIVNLGRNLRHRLRVLSKSEPKVFCIGFNKTGTTSVQRSLVDLGYVVGNQRTAERLLYSYRAREYFRIRNYCRTAEAFQDIPFSLPYLYVYLDQVFPNSKFVLTVRDSDEDWYNSICRFHSNFYNKGNGVPNAGQLREANYVNKGYAYDATKLMFGTPDDDLYNETILKASYNLHNQSVRQYFKREQDRFLEINLRDPSSYSEFLFVPWENFFSA